MINRYAVQSESNGRGTIHLRPKDRGFRCPYTPERSVKRTPPEEFQNFEGARLDLSGEFTTIREIKCGRALDGCGLSAEKDERMHRWVGELVWDPLFRAGSSHRAVDRSLVKAARSGDIKSRKAQYAKEWSA